MKQVVTVRNLTIGEGMPKICVPIVEKTEDAILCASREIQNTTADLVEWRVDWFESAFDIEAVKGVLAALRESLGKIPLLFTFRTKVEGGEKDISFSKYSELLQEIACTGLADLVDVEVFANTEVATLIAILQSSNVKIVGSNHDFTKTPDKEEIIQRLCCMQSMGVDISKIAVMPQSERDVLTLLQATEEMMREHATGPIITMSMSRMGAVSRVAGEVFGSAVTFGALGKTSAPGQMHVEELRQILQILHRD